jgi:DNA-binding GntR family transcriptional regulator
MPERAFSSSSSGRHGMSKSARVYDDLRALIIGLRLKPGTKLDKHEICGRLSVSRQPLSEAVARLAEEHLLDVAPQKGTYVARIRLSDVAEAAFMRRALEVATVSAVASRVSDEALQRLDRLLDYQTTALKGEDWDGYYVLDVRFHAMLAERLSMPRLASAIEVARAPLERARRLLIPSPGRAETALDEHYKIFAALKARDAERAGVAMGAHIDRFMSEITQFAAENRWLFEQ